MKHQKIDRDYIMLYMPQGGEAGLIQAWYQGQHQWVEFRGPPFSQWIPTDSPSAFEIVHDSLLGMHCTVLHQDSVLALIRGRHSDFDAIERCLLAEQLQFTAPQDYML